MGMTFNEFQRELKKRGIEGHLAIALTAMYEQQRETAEQLDQAMKILLGIVQTVENFVSLNEAMNGRIQSLQQRIAGDVSGVELNSVPLIDEPKD